MKDITKHSTGCDSRSSHTGKCGCYKKMKTDTEDNLTLEQWTDYCDAIALVKVISVSWFGGSKVKIMPLEVYKGTFQDIENITVNKSWMPDHWYTKNETCVVFLKGKSNEYYSQSYYSRWPIDEAKNEITCNNFNEYSPEVFLPAMQVRKDQDNCFLYLEKTQLIEKIKNYNQ